MGGSTQSEDGDMGFQIAPMVDVVFVLLLFFMASVGMKVNEILLHANVSNASKGPVSPIIAPAVIQISADGTVTMNDMVFGNGIDRTLPALRDWLAQNITPDSKDPVLLRPAPDARQERIMDVLNACASSKVKNVTFQ